MNIRIDTSGNLIIGSDSASTTAKQFLLFLLSQLQLNPASSFTYDENSNVKNIAYDADTHQLTWDENGSGQSYSMTTADLQNYVGSCINVIEPSEYATTADVMYAKDAIIYAISLARQMLALDHDDITASLSSMTGGSGDALLTSQEFSNELDEIKAQIYSLDHRVRDLTAGGALVGAGLLATQKPKQTRTK